MIQAQGVLVVPEPSSLALSLLSRRSPVCVRPPTVGGAVTDRLDASEMNFPTR